MHVRFRPANVCCCLRYHFGDKRLEKSWQDIFIFDLQLFVWLYWRETTYNLLN